MAKTLKLLAVRPRMFAFSASGVHCSLGNPQKLIQEKT
jgi:hypothetical protein